uniref:Uncharacterized protein n=1 Tax=Lactuca sativa TaxID=4236 RepID=A0A9R1XFX3_LACSA|nr:hypothetical protein LSAT_V11C500288960 [Lactuca sativa]
MQGCSWCDDDEIDVHIKEAQREINVAHVEVESVENGVAIVKLMGRYSGKIHCHVCHIGKSRCGVIVIVKHDCSLIPESPFYLEGQGGLFEFIQQRLKENGQWLTQKIKNHFATVKKTTINMKYIDEMKIVPLDIQHTCYGLFQAMHMITSPVHFLLKVQFMGPWQGFLRVTEATNVVKLTDRMWARLLASTNQPTNVVKLTFPHE